MDERVTVAAAGLEHQDADAGVLGQAAGENAAGRAGADDNVIVNLHGLPSHAIKHASWATCQRLMYPPVRDADGTNLVR